MFKEKRILTVVPARGGSKGIIDKNIRLVGGVPLVVRAWHVANDIGFIDRIAISTDSEKIISVCANYGVHTYFKRPDDLSGDRIGDKAVLVHALLEMERLDQINYDIILMLQPTSPFRCPGHIVSVISHLIDEGLDSVWTVSSVDLKYHPLKQLIISSNGGLHFYDDVGKNIIARQQLTPTYYRNGIAYAITRDCLLNQDSILGANSGAIQIDGFSISIDYEDELDLANEMMSHFTC